MTIEEKITLIYEMEDNVSSQAKQAGDSAREATEEIDGLGQESAKVTPQLESTGRQAVETGVKARSATEDLRLLEQQQTRTQVKAVTQIAVLMGMKGAVSSVTSGMISLGIVSGDTAIQLQKVNAGFQLVAGCATGIKALTTATHALNGAQAINNALSTFKAVLTNPLALGAVAIAGGAAVGTLGAMYLKGGNTTTNTTNTTINVTDSEPAKATASEIYAISGGAL